MRSASDTTEPTEEGPADASAPVDWARIVASSEYPLWLTASWSAFRVRRFTTGNRAKPDLVLHNANLWLRCVAWENETQHNSFRTNRVACLLQSATPVTGRLNMLPKYSLRLAAEDDAPSRYELLRQRTALAVDARPSPHRAACFVELFLRPSWWGPTHCFNAERGHWF